ncbi:MAG: hypothetical protein JW844_03250 [Candidatus Omnitrophica bacterium]|nr:hypothetical protein [Candidatus Omnitrophota bacterium]
MVEQKKFKRRVFVVDKTFQFKYIRMVLILCMYVISVGNLIGFIVLRMSMEQAGVATGDTLDIIYKTIGFMSSFQLAVAVPLILFCGIILTHRVIGPFVRLERFLADLGKGDVGKQFHLREKDELKQLVDWINKMSMELAELKGQGKLS